jgi:hypothetical protein
MDTVDLRKVVRSIDTGDATIQYMCGMGAAVSRWSVGATFTLTYDTVEIMTALSVDAKISSKTKKN